MAPKEKTIDLEELPERFRKPIVRLMAAENLDLTEALERAGLLLERNSEEYSRELQAGANSIYKSRFMTEVNKVRAALDKEHKKALSRQWDDGFQSGYTYFKTDCSSWHIPCSQCGKLMHFSSDDPNFAETSKVLENAFSGWRHINCNEVP